MTTTTTTAPPLDAARSVRAMEPAERAAFFRALYGMTDAERRRRCPWRPRGYFTRARAYGRRDDYHRRPRPAGRGR